MSKDLVYKDLISFHPGNYVSEIVDDLNITQDEFARRIGISSKTISRIINHEDGISPGTASKLATVTGVSVQTWLNLQARYDAKVQEIENAQTNDEIAVANDIDTAYLKKCKIFEDRRYTINEKIQKLRQVLKVSNLSKLAEFNPAVSYRRVKTDHDDKSIVVSNTMLELATNEARNKSNIKYSKEKLEQKLSYIKKLNLESPGSFFPKLENVLLECGIVLVAIPNMPGARLNGATKRFKNGSVLLLFTDRNKWADAIWFSIVHELGHIYYEDFFSDYDDQEGYKKKEKKADEFAANFFIAPNAYSSFIGRGIFTEESIINFANEMGVIPSIVVGRLQSDEIIDYSTFNELKTKYKVLKNFAC
ncbi:HigA family addiction module antitoxin [Furfurilactobacillus milii]|uniref:HigA family addiction module antitoxin n=1 Tax=Furfurilactobacillus milii TaxID=2888272 RepID=UPI001EED9B7C|nr:HigA family addiction module antitoxin [Furfurilactobacillus milii]MCF6419811.1 HigA family addiction module antidote protein [Furfurilactobacillus milii]